MHYALAISSVFYEDLPMFFQVRAWRWTAAAVPGPRRGRQCWHQEATTTEGLPDVLGRARFLSHRRRSISAAPRGSRLIAGQRCRCARPSAVTKYIF
jgi:hypothetical protein